MLENGGRFLIFSLSLLLLGCELQQPPADLPNQDADSDSDIDTPPSPNPGCTPTVTCLSLGARCDDIVDDCGNTVNCGSCYLPYVCGGLGTPNKCENPCNPNPCTAGNKTICNSTFGGYVCSCEPGYEDNGSGSCVKQKAAIMRLMSANITSGDQQTYQAPGIRIFKGLKPDIVMIQEFNYRPDLDPEFAFENITDFVKNTFGPEFSFHRGSGSIPNGIISRYPIKDSGQWIQESYQNRQYEWARIDIPGDKDLWAISVHLLTTKDKREIEAEELAEYIKKNVPKDVYIAIGGDFNTSSRNEYVYDYLRDVVVIKGEYPDDQAGNEDTNRNRDKTYDGIYVDKDLHAKETAAIVGDTSHESGLVFDSRKFKPLSAVSPVQYGDSNAENMQHMAVIRDFKLW